MHWYFNYHIDSQSFDRQYSIDIMCAEQEDEDEEHNRLLASNADDEGSNNKEEIVSQQPPSQSSTTSINAVYVGPKQFAISFLAFWLVAAIISASVLHPESQNPRINTTSNNSNSTTANNEMVTQSTTTPTTKNLYPNGRPSTWPAPIYNTSFVSYLKSGMEIMLKKKQERGVHQYKYDSPFEARWPGSEQPYWARKTIPYNRHINREVCFVHVGKAGGSTGELVSFEVYFIPLLWLCLVKLCLFCNHIYIYIPNETIQCFITLWCVTTIISFF